VLDNEENTHYLSTWLQALVICNEKYELMVDEASSQFAVQNKIRG